jgi:outer membrane immunogenic protein
VLALAAGAASASAADIQQRQVMPVKAPIYATPPYNWTGGYIGINGGGGWGSSDFSGLPFATNSFRTSGGLVGGTLGYNWQAGPMVYGVEGDLDWSDIRGTAACAGTTCETRNNWLGTVRGRLGYAIDRWMPYVTGGAAFGDIQNNIAGIGSNSNTKAGWTAGGGIEAAIAGPWTAKLEYLYVDLGNSDPIAGSRTNFHTNLVRAGLNYRF